MIFNSSNIITASLIAVLTLFSGAVANAQKPMSPDRSTVQVQDTAKVPLLSPNYDDETEHTPLDNILPLSPQAASLARYGEYPVSHATGIPDITIPIYEIKLGDFTLPISISYHASGIKVDDVASTVGLGWTLNAGGAVTRQICGAPDITDGSISNEFYDYAKTKELIKSVHENDDGTAILNGLLLGNGNTSNRCWDYDCLSDRYYFNFAGKSGIFRYSYRENSYIPINYSNIYIDGYIGIHKSHFRIVDTDGIEFIFMQPEYVGVRNEENITDITAWYLTEINTSNGSITIEYNMSEEFEIGNVSEAVYMGYFGHYRPADDPNDSYSDDYNDMLYQRYQSGNMFRTPVVSKITWNGGHVNFHYENDRKDIWHTRLRDIVVVNSEGDTVKSVMLKNNIYWGNNNRNYRMMLKGLVDSSTGEYAMNYNTDCGFMPDYRISGGTYSNSFINLACQQDYWGYYNGKTSWSFISKASYLYIKNRITLSYKAHNFSLDYFADRSCNGEYMKYGIIRNISYPTGGNTNFVFEPNGNNIGGLRIKEIVNCCSNADTLTTTFSYGYPLMTIDSLETMTVYDEYCTVDNFPFGGGDYNIRTVSKCVGNPVLPIMQPSVFYRTVRETYKNGEYTIYEYDGNPELGTACGYTGIGNLDLHAPSYINDFGNTVPFLIGKAAFSQAGKLCKRETFKYKCLDVKNFSAGCKVTSLVKSKQNAADFMLNEIVNGPIQVNSETVIVDSVTVHSNVFQLMSKETIDYATDLTFIENYTYDDCFRTDKPRSIAIENSDGKTYSTEYRYAFDFGDEWHRKMVGNYNMLDAVVETRKSCDGRLLETLYTEYAEINGWIYPKCVLKSVLDGSSFEMFRFIGYDKAGNITGLVTNTCDIDNITWGYNRMYPTEHLHNGTLVTEYSWKPLCGIVSVKNQNGYTECYGYDNGGRLSSVSDSYGMKQKLGYKYCNDSSNDNYVKTIKFLSTDETFRNVSLQYADGLGRPYDIATDATSESGKFVHSFSSYDGKGRVCRKWLPAVSNNGGKILSEQDIADISRNTYGDSMAYSDISYDALDRSVYESTPGIVWKGKGKCVEYVGNGNRDIRLFSAPLDKISLVDNGFYKPNMLHGEKTTDEDGHSVTVFTDKLGRKILERRNDGNCNNDTYFVYNDLGQLRYVLSPEYQRAGYKDKYAYEYRYDERGNVVKKILPGCEPIQYWYDRGDRLSFMQDASLRDKGLYRFYLYDRLGRMVVQGLCSGCNRDEEVNIAEFKENIVGICNTGYKIPLSDKITNPNLETVNYYDNYGFLQNYSAELGNLISDFHVKGICALGLQTGMMQVTSDGGKVIDAFFYDGKGLVVDSRRLYLGKRLTCIHTDYSYTGKPTKIVTDEYSIDSGRKTLVVSQVQDNTYSNKTDRLITTSFTVNGKKETIQKLEYDDLGRMKSVTHGGSAGAVSYDYNLHGWTTNIGSKDFHEELHYTDGVGTPCFNGNISSLLWSTSDYGQVRGYKFEYDGLDRLKEAVYGETPSLSDKQNRYNEKVIEYTANGAMKRFQRRGRKDDGEYGKIDNLHIKLNGNQLLNVVDDALPANKYSSFNFIDGANETVEYEYNGVGALTKDLNRGITIRYDNLDYPRRIDFKDGNSITYTYLPDGTLLSKEYGLPYNIEKEKVNGVIGIDNAADRVSTEASSLSDTIMAAQPGMILLGETEYSGNVIYKNGKLDKVLFPGGYCTFDSENNSQPIFHYYTQDHLGNNRTVTNEDGTVEQIVHYYPFGGTFNDAGLNTGLQQYKYNGKELDRVAGLNTYDYGARQYFSALPVWDRVDPKCEEDYGVSPYAYCRNSPIKFIDKDGNKVRIPNKDQRTELLNYISVYFQQGLNVDKDGFLFVSDRNVVNGNGSKIFTDNLIKAINNKELTIRLLIDEKISIEKNKTISVSDMGDGATYFISNKEIGSAITGKSHVVYDKNNQPIEQTPADIIMHELFGHAIPKIINADYSTGNAIKNENIIRRELNLQERDEHEDNE